MAHICCSGAVMSSLLFELFQSSKIQEGFFLGKIEKVVSQSISDAEICSEDTQYSICISAFYPLSGLGSFYSGSGKIDEAFIKSIMGRNFENVIGWYRYRGSCEELYLKEMKISQRLTEFMSHSDGYFTFGVISGSPVGTSGTMDITYRFNILSNGVLQSIPVIITNMKDTSTSHYIRSDTTLPLYSSDALQSILGDLKIFEPAVKDVEKMHLGLLLRLRELLPKFAAVQEKCREKALEVNQLRALCHSRGILPEYQQKREVPSTCDLMEFEPVSPKVKTRRAPAHTSRASSEEGPKRKNSARRGKRAPKNKPCPESTDELFDFVDKEMENLQESPKSITDENSNTLNNDELPQAPKTGQRKSFKLRSSQERTLSNSSSTPSKNKENRGTRSSSCDSSPNKVDKAHSNLSPIKAVKDSDCTKEKSPYMGKMKSSRMQNRSLERNSPIHSNRQRSPSKSETKSKVKECWTNTSNNSKC